MSSSFGGTFINLPDFRLSHHTPFVLFSASRSDCFLLFFTSDQAEANKSRTILEADAKAQAIKVRAMRSQRNTVDQNQTKISLLYYLLAARDASCC